jgi:hypothetical protein
MKPLSVLPFIFNAVSVLTQIQAKTETADEFYCVNTTTDKAELKYMWPGVKLGKNNQSCYYHHIRERENPSWFTFYTGEEVYHRASDSLWVDGKLEAVKDERRYQDQIIYTYTNASNEMYRWELWEVKEDSDPIIIERTKDGRFIKTTAGLTSDRQFKGRPPEPPKTSITWQEAKDICATSMRGKFHPVVPKF